MKVLLVDDDPDVSSLLKRFLAAKGREVLAAANGREALEMFSKEVPDLVILDVVMPEVHGWEVLSRIRETSSVPIIMLTGQNTSTDTVKGLLSGADDYITKPFDLGELEARITALMRRYPTSAQTAIFQVGPLTIDDGLKEVTARNHKVKLSPKEYEILKLLAGEPGKVFSHKEIIAAVWQNKPFISSADVTKYIYLLREKLEIDADQPEILLTVRGFGYKLSC